MERIWGEDTVFVLVGTLFTLWMAARAWKKGAMDLIWTITSWTGGAAAGFWTYHNGGKLLKDYAGLELGSGMAVLASFVLGVVVFAVVRAVSKQFFTKVFGPETAAGRWMFGGTGSILSTLPSLAVLIFLGLVIRTSGTLTELHQIDRVMKNQDLWSAATYPREPMPARWRNGVENLPHAEAVLDLFDPLSSVTRRNLAMILAGSYNPYLRQKLRQWPATARAASHPSVVYLVESNLEVTEILAGVKGDWKYLRLLKHETLREALRDKSLRRELSKMDAAGEIRAILTGQEPQPRKKWLQRIFS